VSDLCVHVKADGKACQMSPWPGAADNRCFWHSAEPTAIAKRQGLGRAAVAARRRIRDQKNTTPHLPPLSDLRSALNALAWIALELAAGRITPRVANQLTATVNLFIRAQDYATRIAAFEKQKR
jgi:hypothetical protein